MSNYDQVFPEPARGNRPTPVLLVSPVTGEAYAAGGGGSGGDASAANQVTGNTTLAAINTKTPSLGQANSAGSSPVVIASDQSVIPVNQAGVSATGSITALNGAVPIALNGATGFAIDLRGTFTATVTFQGTINGTDWFPVAVLPAGGSVNVASVTTATAAGAWVGSGSGFVQVRAIATAFTSGTISVVVRAMQAAGIVATIPTGQTTQVVSGSVTASGTVTANIGTGSLAAGTNAIGDVGIQYRGNATGAGSATNFVAAGSTNAAVLKASAGRLLGFVLTNNATAVRYVKFHNQTTTPTAGTGVVQTYGIPPNGGTITLSVPGGIGFGTGIAYTTTTGAAASDATAVTANDIVGTFHWA